MTSLALSPALAIPGRDVSVTFTLSQPTANFIRVWCISAPDGSDLATKIKSAASSTARVIFYEGDGGADHPLRTKLDKGGLYGFTAQEYLKGTGFSGGFQGDTRADQTENALGGEASLSLSVGKRQTCAVGAGQDTATLALWIFGDTIQATTLALHGETTPAIGKPSSPKATAASQTGAVTTALAALAGVDATTAIGSPAAFVADFVAQFAAHCGDATVHANADADNPIRTELAAAPTPSSLASFVGEALRRLRQHETNDYGPGIGSSNGLTVATVTAPNPYHFVVHNAADLQNVPLVRGASGPDDSYAALSDLYRAYEAHRVSLFVHNSADTTHALATLSPMQLVHFAFFVALASITPTPAPGDTAGSALLKQWGFKES